MPFLVEGGIGGGMWAINVVFFKNTRLHNCKNCNNVVYPNVRRRATVWSATKEIVLYTTCGKGSRS